MKLKVCGMRESTNISELIKVQPNFIGFIFHKASSRNVTEIPSIEIPSNIKKVGVFVNETVDYISDKVAAFGLDYIQLHGNETPEFCVAINKQGLKIIKAFNIHAAFDFTNLKSYEPCCSYFLFDAVGEKSGGNGITFNWELINQYKGYTPFLLSGGINEKMANKIQSIKHPKFIGIDVNSGFEIEPGLKDVEKIKNFKNSVIANGE